MDTQRIYDAMLIKAFRADVTLNQLRWWLKIYKINLPEETLKRQPKYLKMRVQPFVGAYLKPLADRLWDTNKSEDIQTLDWMKNLECKNTANRITSELSKLRDNNINNRRKAGFFKANQEYQKISNQWNVTK
jgi:uncharacterized protein (UPF0305 family)